MTFSLKDSILEQSKELFKNISWLPLEDRIDLLNSLRSELHKQSPFSKEPVDCVLWIKSEEVIANDYNPNSVAPPEMALLKHSVSEDGYTQPIVSWKKEDVFEVVDGFHRHRVGKECLEVKNRIKGYLPITVINESRTDRSDRIASTIRHNRARGKHQIEAMSEIVIELKRRNWKDERICRELGMDQDEVLRLCQITGLAELFSDKEFSKSWDIEDGSSEFIPLEEEFELLPSENFRTVNTSDGNRVFHTHDKWECYKAGFYATTFDGMSKLECEYAYRDFLADIPRFKDALKHVIEEWKYSCEHYLTNSGMNRIAWLGQASMCYATGIPSTFKSGFNLLSYEQQEAANEAALIYLNKWLLTNNRNEVTMDEAISDNQMELY